MKLIVADSAGFCHGVRRAVRICEEASETYPVCVTLGPIIHNKHVIRKLEEKGVREVLDVSGIPEGATVIIRSHGLGKKTYEDIKALGFNIIDATCPDVKRIHDIVFDESEAGRLPVIIGERSHPEVTAISEYGGDYVIFENERELSEWLHYGDNADKSVSVVFQTTNALSVYNSCNNLIKKVCTNQKVFDTICSATFKRQQEAAELSGTVDAMIVIGGRNSSNSLRLADICREHCSRVFFAESPEDLENADIFASDIVGITAGASTPAWIIKEVTQKMSDEVMIDETLDNPESEVADTDLVSPEQETENVPEEEAKAEETTQQEDTAIAAEPEPPADDPEVDVSEQPEEPGPDEEEPDAATAEVDIAAEDPEDSCEINIDKQEDLSSAQDTDTPAEQDSETAAAETFEEMLEKSIKTLRSGEKVSGIVTSITATEVSVDLGTKQSGYIPIGEFIDDTNASIEDIINIGDTIEAFVMRVNDVEGMVMLSKKRLDAIKNWDIIEAAKDSRAIVEGLVTEENKGGVVVNVKGVRVFVPASQTGLPKSAPMSELLRKTIKLRITEVNQSRRRVVGSIRAVQSDERRERADRLWNEIETGKQYEGVVKSMTSYGVFVDIGGVDGMIHISELSWTRIKQPSEVMAVGDEVSVYVLAFDKDNRKISLGYKKQDDNPWSRFTKGNSVGDIVSVKIVKMMPFGAFAEIVPGVDGLIHISQITDHRIGLPSEVLTNGQTVNVKITEIDNDRKKVSLSIRALIDPASQPVTAEEAEEAVASDKRPVVVYDTDAPPEEIPEPEDALANPAVMQDDPAEDVDGIPEDNDIPEEEAAEETAETAPEETADQGPGEDGGPDPEP